jgi:phosphatidylglycerophosphate synthase
MRAVQPADEDTLLEVKPADEIAPPAIKATGANAARVVLRTSLLGLLGTAALLAVLSVTTGLALAGWITGLASGPAAAALLVTARIRSDQPSIHPADWVTLTRAILAAGVAGLAADSYTRPVQTTALITLAIIALILDAVDGHVARLTSTATPLGAKLDGEVDAFLILLLAVIVSQRYGLWVLAIGAARYAFLVAGWLVPWLTASLPPRFWRKTVAAIQGIALTVAASGQLNRLVGMLVVAAALLLLIESFGHDVIWLYRAGVSARTRSAVLLPITGLSVVVVWTVLVAPDRLFQLTPAAFARIPIEALVLIGLALVLPARARRIVAAVAGVLFGLLALIKIFDMGFYAELGRPFSPLFDWGNISPAVGVVRDAIGTKSTNIAFVALAAGLILIIAGIAASAVRITTVAAEHRRITVRALAALTAVWALSAGLSLHLAPGFPIASSSDTSLVVAQVHNAQAALREQHRFALTLRGPDPQAAIPASDLLTGLRGKDVVVAFVESYGKVAVQGTSFSHSVDALLHRRTASLARAGWSAQSAWIKSATLGGISWLNHSTFQSGLWVDSDQLYDKLVASHWFTLVDAFNKAGWRTVSDAPEDDDSWPTGASFFGFDKLYGRHDVGYRGPSFSYASMPDQYTLAEFQRRELAPGHKPVMAEIDLVSSHTPWALQPTMVPWNKVGNGSIFDPMPARSEPVAQVWRSRNTVRKFFAKSIRYSLTALTSWVTEAKDPNLVLIVLGDEQPSSVISGNFASHDVPISIIAHDPSVFRHIASWHWQDGLLPGGTAPLEPMSAFRNKFIGAFSTAP